MNRGKSTHVFAFYSASLIALYCCFPYCVVRGLDRYQGVKSTCVLFLFSSVIVVLAAEAVVDGSLCLLSKAGDYIEQKQQ